MAYYDNICSHMPNCVDVFHHFHTHFLANYCVTSLIHSYMGQLCAALWDSQSQPGTIRTRYYCDASCTEMQFLRPLCHSEALLIVSLISVCDKTSKCINHFYKSKYVVFSAVRSRCTKPKVKDAKTKLKHGKHRNSSHRTYLPLLRLALNECQS